MRVSFLLIALLPAASALAQALPPVDQDQPLDPRKNQKIEHLHVEDNANKIDEVRVGGEMRSTKVQPKGHAPAYQIEPGDLAHSTPGEARNGLADRKPRVWNLLDF
jgi:hypothetical protein